MTITFDAAGRICQRGIGWGQFAQVAREIQERASGDVRGYDLGGALIAVPSLFPNELSEVVRDALVLRMPEPICRSLLPHERAAWARGA